LLKQRLIKRTKLRIREYNSFEIFLTTLFPSFKFVQSPSRENIYIQEKHSILSSHNSKMCGAVIQSYIYKKRLVCIPHTKQLCGLIANLFHLLMETGVFFCLTRNLSVRLILVGSCFTKKHLSRNLRMTELIVVSASFCDQYLLSV